jgi:hypothetical protein
MPATKHDQTAEPQHPSPEEIAAKAYERWVARGQPMGQDQEDWFAAEAELHQPAEPKPSALQRIRSALRRLSA